MTDAATKLITPAYLADAVYSNCVVVVFADWCGHCTKFAPIYEQVARELKGGGELGVNVHFCRLNYPKHGEAVTKERIGKESRLGGESTLFADLVKEFPTVVMYRKSASEPLVYTGGPDAEALRAAITTFFAEESARAHAAGVV